jgi:hypothetical protein
MLRAQLEAWTIEPGQEAAYAQLTRLADPAFVPMSPRLRDVLSSLAQNISEGLPGLKKRIDRLTAEACAAFMQFELCGREFALVLAFCMLVDNIDRVALSAEEEQRMRFAYKQLDELTVVIMNSLSHAVRTHDPRARAAEMMQIRQAREQGGDRAARAVVRSLIEQQAFYPRAWARWLGEASQDRR